MQAVRYNQIHKTVKIKSRACEGGPYLQWPELETRPGRKERDRQRGGETDREEERQVDIKADRKQLIQILHSKQVKVPTDIISHQKTHTIPGRQLVRMRDFMNLLVWVHWVPND